MFILQVRLQGNIRKIDFNPQSLRLCILCKTFIGHIYFLPQLQPFIISQDKSVKLCSIEREWYPTYKAPFQVHL